MSSQMTAQIREWGKTPTPDGARLLIRTYRESEWRETRLEVIRELGRFQDSRSFQFLVEIIGKNQDLAEQELAILALGQRKNRASASFLRRFHGSAPEALKSSVAYAIGQAQVFSLGEVLLEDFDTAASKQNVIWLKSIILALGELKEFRALPRIEGLLRGKLSEETDLKLAVLFALGRLERDPDQFSEFESLFFNETLTHQVFQSALSQVQIRSQFKLEDYLTKIFESPHPHAVLPLELRAFDEEEVKVGLSLFDLKSHWKRTLFAMRGLPKATQAEMLPMVYEASGDAAQFFELLAESSEMMSLKGLSSKLKTLASESLKNAHIRIRFCRAFSEEINFIDEATFFLGENKADDAAIEFINLWSERALSLNLSEAKKELKSLTGFSFFSETVLARLYRAAAELEIEDKVLTDRLVDDFKKVTLRSSLLLYAERFSLPSLLGAVLALGEEEMDGMAARILPYLESLADLKEFQIQLKPIEKVLAQFEKHFNLEFVTSVLRVIRKKPLPQFEKIAVSKINHGNTLVELNAVIALKSYPDSREASEALSQKLGSKSPVVRGRALDALCAHRTLLAKRAIIQHLKDHLNEEELVDKVYRSFDPEQKGGEEFVKAIVEILRANPDHPQWEKLVSLRDRLGSSIARETATTQVSSPELEALDQRLLQAIPKFKGLDEATKLALRAAEQPFLQVGDNENLPIDKAPTVLEYCKALDLILEKHLGQKHLFPKLDRELHDFQTIWHRVGFGEDYPPADKVIGLLGLKGKIQAEHFPLHKAKMMCGTFFNGKILQDRFKIFDGLRAWAVIFLVFTRKIPLTTGPIGPILKFQGVTDEKCLFIAKRLMTLQDLRNPAAHRQTYTDLSSVKTMRNDSVELINTILELVL